MLSQLSDEYRMQARRLRDEILENGAQHLQANDQVAETSAIDGDIRKIVLSEKLMCLADGYERLDSEIQKRQLFDRDRRGHGQWLRNLAVVLMSRIRWMLPTTVLPRSTQKD